MPSHRVDKGIGTGIEGAMEVIVTKKISTRWGGFVFRSTARNRLKQGAATPLYDEPIGTGLARSEYIPTSEIQITMQRMAEENQRMQERVAAFQQSIVRNAQFTMSPPPPLTESRLNRLVRDLIRRVGDD